MAALLIIGPENLLVRARDLAYLSLGCAVLAALLYFTLRQERRKLRGTVVLYCLGLALLLIERLTLQQGFPASATMHEAGVLFVILALIGLLSLAIFGALLPTMRLGTPRIVRDLCVAAGYVATIFWMLSHVRGMTLSNLVTTSA